MNQRTKIARGALIAVTLAAFAGCSGGTTSTFTLPAGAKWTMGSGKDTFVDSSDNVYTPQFVEVKKGAKITWENTGRNRHNVLPNEEGAFTEIPVDKLDPGMKASVTFDEVGEFGYYCSLHGSANKGMFGAIKVVE